MIIFFAIKLLNLMRLLEKNGNDFQILKNYNFILIKLIKIFLKKKKIIFV